MISQALKAGLFQIKAPTINGHLKLLNAEGETQSVAIIRKFRIVRQDGFLQVSRK